MNNYSLFRRSRLRLAIWYAGVMGVILSVSGFGMYRAMVQSNWTAMKREIESIAGTLHNSVEPLLSASEEPTAVLQQIFPDLCLSGQPCNATPTLIQQHTIGISDRTTYYIRLFNRHLRK
jgi:two-component system, OmpR family, Ni(II)-sensor and/or redox sensor kinase NrsS